jgi:hypothetical protein
MDLSSRFYATHDLLCRIDKLQPLVDVFAPRYSHYSPYQALGGLTSRAPATDRPEAALTPYIAAEFIDRGNR